MLTRHRSSRPSTRFSIPPQIFDIGGKRFERVTICDVSGCCRPWVKLRSGGDNTSRTRQHLCVEHRELHIGQWHDDRKGTYDWELQAQRLFLQDYHPRLWASLVEAAPC